MALNITSIEVIDATLNDLSASSLLQIAKHIEASLKLARSFNTSNDEQLSFVRDDRKHALHQLSVYCYKVIELQAELSIKPVKPIRSTKEDLGIGG